MNWTIGNKNQWNLNRNSNIFIQENAFEYIVWKMAAILSRPQYVNPLYAELIFENAKLFLHCLWYLDIEMVQVVEIHPWGGWRFVWPTLSMLWLLMGCSLSYKRINSLWPGDTIWWYSSWSSSLTPSQYLDLRFLIIIQCILDISLFLYRELINDDP